MLGLNFLEDGGYLVREHLKKWALFQALSEAVVARFVDDISEFLREDRSVDAAWRTEAGFLGRAKLFRLRPGPRASGTHLKS